MIVLANAEGLPAVSPDGHALDKGKAMSATSDTSSQLIEASDTLYEGIALVRAVYMAAASLQIRDDVDAIQYAAESAISRLNAVKTMIQNAKEGL